jgi:hypothetical protein
VQTLLDLHFFMVPLILLAAILTLAAIIILLVLRRGMPDSEAPTAGPVALWTRIFRILLWITAGLGVLQPIFGGLIYLNGGRPEDQLHFVYGGLVLLAIPVAYVYSDQKRVRRDLWIMLIAVVIVIGAAFRALATGGALPVGH